MCLLDDVSQLATIHYNYTYSPAPQGTSEENMEDAKAHIDATVTQLFYTSNMFHDLFYRCVLFLLLTRQTFLTLMSIATASRRKRATSSNTTLGVEVKKGTL